MGASPARGDRWHAPIQLALALTWLVLAIPQYYRPAIAQPTTTPPGVWELVTVPITRGHTAVACATPGDCWIANSRHVFPTDPPSTTLQPLMRWTGGDWVALPGTPAASDIDFAAPDDGWAVWGACERPGYTGCLGKIYHWDGQVWTHMITVYDYALLAVDAVSANEAWFAGGQILFHDDPQGQPAHIVELPAVYRWDGSYIGYVEPPQDQAPCSAVDVQRVPGGPVRAACIDLAHTTALLLNYDDAVWTIEDLGAQAFPRKLDLLAPLDGWAAAENAYLHFGASGWEIVPSPGGLVYALDMLDSEHGWAVGGFDGVSSHLSYFEDGSWTSAGNPVSNTLVDVVVKPPVVGWAVSYDLYPPNGQDVVLRYRDATFTPRLYLPLVTAGDPP